MKPPAFWDMPAAAPGPIAGALAPLASLYAAGTARRLRQPGYQANIPVICIGNINAGGTGKTPTTIAIAGRLIDAGHSPHIVSRGYGGALAGPVEVNPTIHTAAQTGDEPLMLAGFAPTWIAKDRAAGVRSAEAAGASHILLDDGFQNPAVTKDASLVVVDARRGFGNGRVIPAGPLREPVTTGLARATAVLSIGGAADQDHFRTTWGGAIGALPHITARLDPLPTGMPWQGLRAVAFAGIGYPDKFFRTLRDMGVDVVHSVPLNDHQEISSTLFNRIAAEAKRRNAHILTTEKDAVRLPPDLRARVMPVPVRLTVDDWPKLDRLLGI